MKRRSTYKGGERGKRKKNPSDLPGISSQPFNKLWIYPVSKLLVMNNSLPERIPTSFLRERRRLLLPFLYPTVFLCPGICRINRSLYLNISWSEVKVILKITQASSFNLPHFSKLAETLQRHRAGLLSYFRHRISTGPLEGINNKIKVLKRQAYGFRDKRYFKLRLFFLHEQTPAFAG
jgi:hypothetical protein